MGLINRHNQIYLGFIVFVLFTFQWVKADVAPKVGKAAAAKYFQKNPQATKEIRYPSNESSSSEGYSLGSRFLMFGFSTFTQSDAYSWGSINKEEDVGKWGVDMTYRLDTTNLMDYALRVNYTNYKPNNQDASKMSFMFAAILPDAASKFPLYFGAAAGPGVFFSQIGSESNLTLDYQLFLGLRIFDLVDNSGFYIEGGMKNHLQLTSDGQLNGTFVSAGGVFTF